MSQPKKNKKERECNHSIQETKNTNDFSLVYQLPKSILYIVASFLNEYHDFKTRCAFAQSCKLFNEIAKSMFETSFDFTHEDIPQDHLYGHCGSCNTSQTINMLSKCIVCGDFLCYSCGFGKEGHNYCEYCCYSK